MERKLHRGQFYGETLKSKEGAGLLLTETTYSPNSTIRRHSHEDAYFCLVLQGGYSETCERKTWWRTPSSLAFHPPAESHANQIQNAMVRDFSIEVSPGWIKRIREHSTALDNPANYQGGIFASLSTKLYHEFKAIDDVSPLMIEAFMLELVAEISRRRLDPVGRKSPSWLRMVRDRIHAEFANPLTISNIAKDIGFHPVYVASEFRRCYSCTIGEYVRHLRITYACDEIIKDLLPLSQIALAAGFCDQSHFSKSFKRSTGMTPIQYKIMFRPS